MRNRRRSKILAFARAQKAKSEMSKRLSAIVLLALFMISSLVVSVKAQEEVLIDYYDFYITFSILTAIHPSSTTAYSGIGQRRIPTMKGYSITKVKFELSKVGSPEGNLRAVVMDETYAIKAESNAVDMSAIPTARTLTEFTFATRASVPTTQYSIAVIAKDATVLDGSNYIRVSCGANGDKYDGEDSCKISFKLDRWYYTPTWDCIFYVYGIVPFSATSIAAPYAYAAISLMSLALIIGVGAALLSSFENQDMAPLIPVVMVGVGIFVALFIALSLLNAFSGL